MDVGANKSVHLQSNVCKVFACCCSMCMATAHSILYGSLKLRCIRTSTPRAATTSIFSISSPTTWAALCVPDSCNISIIQKYRVACIHSFLDVALVPILAPNACSFVWQQRHESTLPAAAAHGKLLVATGKDAASARDSDDVVFEGHFAPCSCRLSYLLCRGNRRRPCHYIQIIQMQCPMGSIAWIEAV